MEGRRFLLENKNKLFLVVEAVVGFSVEVIVMVVGLEEDLVVIGLGVVEIDVVIGLWVVICVGVEVA